MATVAIGRMDVLAAADTSSIVSTHPIGRSDVLTASSSQSTVATHPIGRSDVLTASSSQSTVATHPIGSSDVLTASSSQSTVATHPIGRSDVLTASSSQTTAATHFIGRSDALAAIDTLDLFVYTMPTTVLPSSAVGVQASKHVDMLKGLMPPVSYAAEGTVMMAHLSADGAALDRAMICADTIMAESDPRTCYTSVAEWERVAGLPDACAGVGLSNLDARRKALAAKLMFKGGASADWLMQMAANMGYAGVTVDTFNLPTCDGNCDQFTYGTDWVYAFQLNIPGGIAIHYATCAGSCEDELATWETNSLACRINNIKPAHTVAILNYH